MRAIRNIYVVMILVFAVMLAACAPETERAANCEEFGALFRINYEESAGFSALTPYQWGGLEIEGCALLVPPGGNLFSLIGGSDMPTLYIYDALAYTGESTLVSVYEAGMGADEWVEKTLTGESSAKAVTSMTLSNKDSAAGISNDGGNMAYIAAYVAKDKAYLCVMQVPSSYVSENSSKLLGAEKDLAAIAKSAEKIPLKPKE